MKTKTIDASSVRSFSIETEKGVSIYAEQKGEGSELVVFLHAVGGDHSSWYPQMDCLSNRYSCASLDLRGHGKSTCAHGNGKIEEAISISKFAQDVAVVIEKLGFYRAHLVGLSMGGVVALETFKQRPIWSSL